MLPNRLRRDEPSGAVVTGIGIECPLGASPQELVERIEAGHSAIGEIVGFDVSGLEFKHAAEIRRTLGDGGLEKRRPGLDRTAVLAIVAARRAVEDAHLDLGKLPPSRVGLVIGICAGGQKDQVALGRAGEPRGRARALLATSHHFITHAVAEELGVHGPCLTLSTACASSGSALASALDLLNSGRLDVVIAGGADAFSFFTYAGFFALGAMATQACSPFASGIGVTFGEAGAFVVLEREPRAAARGARVYGALLAYGATADCYHMTAPDPSGSGLLRAMRNGVARAGLALAQVQYVNAHGTGTRDNDLAETSAVRALFSDSGGVPPVSSSKSFFGHTLGAAGALEFIVSLLCQREGLIPPTLNFNQARAGCDLDYVPNQARRGSFAGFVSNSAAFGGVNVALVGGGKELLGARLASPLERDLVVTGMGIVSSLGCELARVQRALQEGQRGLTRSALDGAPEGRAASFDLRALVPTADPRRLDRICQLALSAATLAIRDANLADGWDLARTGTVMGLTRGPAATEQRFLEALQRDGLRRLSPKYFPAIVLSTLCGQVCEALRLGGATATIVDGAGAGLSAFLQGALQLRSNPDLDAVLVIAADELGGLYRQAYADLGLTLGPNDPFALYDGAGRGFAPAEGAVAMLIERASAAQRRGARVRLRVLGEAMSCDALDHKPEPEGRWLASAIRDALAASELAPEAVDLIGGHGRGIASVDQRELSALRAVFGERRVPLSCASGNTGVMEAASSLFAVASAALSMGSGLAFPLVSDSAPGSAWDFVTGSPRAGLYRTALITSSTEYGNNTALVIGSSRVEEGS
jgi:3-oxoacyl-[acyl-carrier-protein] synthase II